MLALDDLSDDIVLKILSTVAIRDVLKFAICNSRCNSLSKISVTENPFAVLMWLDFADDLNVTCDKGAMMKWTSYQER